MSSFDDPVIISCSISGVIANRDQCPAIPYTPEEYAAEALRPDVAALNMSSMNYAKYSRRRKDFVFKAVFENSFDTIIEFLTAMKELGIKPEHECFDAGHVANLDPLLDMGLLERPLQISLVMGVNGGIRPNARNYAVMSEQIPGGPEGANQRQGGGEP